MAEDTIELDGSLKMLTRVAASKTEFRMSSWANFYRGLANEARLRAAQTASLSEKDKFEKVAMEWSALAGWAEQKQR
jgi:hypothetical protein